MRVIKVAPASYERMVKSMGPSCRFVKLPSSKEFYAFIGVVMADGAWVSWPDNLTDDEMALYIERFGSPPDIFSLGQSESIHVQNLIRNRDGKDQTDPNPSA
jgi:hypothetical protein